MSDWYCRYCSHYTNSNRCTCDDPPEPLPKSIRVKQLSAEIVNKESDVDDLQLEISQLKKELKALKRSKK